MTIHEVIRRPIVTEKGVAKREAENTLCFEVNGAANKTQVRQAVEKLFKVKVAEVRTMNIEGKLRRRGRFAVTPKQGETGRQVRPVAVPLAVAGLLAGVAAFGLARDHSPGTVSTAAFAFVHITVLVSGAWPALRGEAPEGQLVRGPALEPLEPVL